MGVMGWIIGIAIFGSLLKKSGRDTEPPQESIVSREEPTCEFIDGISQEEFESIVIHSGKSIKRLSNISVNGPIVYGTVLSSSGISEWDFTIDFNDCGHLTGRYWIDTDNEDSIIPERIAEMIQSAIKNHSISPCQRAKEDGNSSNCRNNDGTSAIGKTEEKVEDAHPEEERREVYVTQPYIPCSFADGISKYDFQQIVKKTIKKHEYVNYRIDELKIFDAKIYGLIRSHTGKSSWRFILDFNDNGRLTGFYHCITDNDDSQTAAYIGEAIKQAILQRSIGIGAK